MKFKSISLAAGLLALSVGAAVAAPAMVEQDLHLRAGPGTGSPVIGVLPGGSTVDARHCGGGWCAVASAEGSGYASSSYLDFAGGYGPVYAAAPPPVVIGPGYYDGWGPGWGPGFGIGIGFGGYHGWHHHGWHHHWH
jgi:uncharacterized protein YraI